MSLKQRLQEDLRKALRERDERRKAVIRMALTEIVSAELGGEGDLSDADLVAVLRKQAQRHRETIEELQQVDRPGRLAAEQAELAILEEYLPELLSREQIAEEARQVIEETGATGMGQMGPVMGRLMGQLKGRADGHLVNEVVRDLLSE